jgi:hypothetical protein
MARFCALVRLLVPAKNLLRHLLLCYLENRNSVGTTVLATLHDPGGTTVA